MKANLLRSLSCLLSVCFALGIATRPTWASAQAGQTGAPIQNSAGQNGAAQSGASEASNIQVENWAKPKPGWLYVLDPKPDAGGPGGRVWLVDPETDKVMGSIRTGDNADFALAPDGSRLYVASIAEDDSSELAVIDTGRGVVLERGSIENREAAYVLPPFQPWRFPATGWR